MNRIKTFENELALIKNEKIRAFVEQVLCLLPAYFFTIPAATRKGNHPDFARGEGGLVRHTKAAVWFARNMFICETCTGKFTDIQKDVIVAALILHDGCKHGKTETDEGYLFRHPLEMIELLQEHRDRGAFEINPGLFSDICGAIATHMGQWTYDRKAEKNVLCKPHDAVGRFVHLCDYLSSRSGWELTI